MGDAYAYVGAIDSQTVDLPAYTTKAILSFNAGAVRHMIMVTADQTCDNMRVLVDSVDPMGVSSPYQVVPIPTNFLFLYFPTLTVGTHTIEAQCGDATSGTVSNIRIFVLDTTLLPDCQISQPANFSTNSVTFVTAATFNFTSLAGNYLVGAAFHALNGDVVYSTIDLVDASSVEKAVAEVRGATKQQTKFFFDITVLTAAAQTYTLRALSSGGSAGVGLSNICFFAIKLPDDALTNESETAGSGVRSTVTFTPTINNLIMGIANTATTGVLTVTQGATTLSTQAVYASAAGDVTGCVFTFTATGISETISCSSTGSSPFSRIVILDLSTLVAGEPVNPIPRLSKPMPRTPPQILLEIMPKLGTVRDVAQPCVWKVLPGSKVNLTRGTELSSFVIRVNDSDRTKRVLIGDFDPCWVWIQAHGKIDRYWFRIEEWHPINDSTNAENIIEITGLSYGSFITRRGRVTDVTKTNVEVADGIINPTTGIMTLVPEVGVNNFVRNTGITLPSMLEMRGDPVKNILDAYRTYASKYEDYGYLFCDGECSIGEEGYPNLHFEKSASELSPTELVVGQTIFFDLGRSVSGLMNYGIIEYGSWGATGDVVGHPIIGTILDSYVEANGDTDQTILTGEAVGQVILAADEKILDELRFNLKKSGTPVGTITAKVYETAGPVSYDYYEKLMLHMNGPDAGTTFEDSSIFKKTVTAVNHAQLDVPAKTVTAVNHAQIDTAQSKFGGASGLFDGTDDDCTTPSSADWVFGADAFTVDFWVRFNSVAANQGLWSVHKNNLEFIEAMWVQSSSTFYFDAYYASGLYVGASFAWSPSINTWYHIACIRSGTNLLVFIDGVLKTTSAIGAVSFEDYGAPFVIGLWQNGGVYLNGWLDEFRVSKGVARWTTTFTPPTVAYTPDQYTVLLLHMDGADASTTFTDSGNFSRFGGACGLFDGTDDYCTLVDSDDWYFGTGDFTVDFHVRFNSLTNAAVFVGQYVDGTNYWYMQKGTNAAGNKLSMVFVSGGTSMGSYIMTSNWSASTSTWYHIAFTKTAGIGYVFIDGVSQTLTESTAFSSNDVGNLAIVLAIGGQNGGSYLNGWLDEFRVSKGIARWTAAFTPPTAQYNNNGPVLMLHGNGPDAGTTILDSSVWNRTVTSVNHTQIDNAQFKFNGSSILFDGTDDALTLVDSHDWVFGVDDFTIDFWVRINVLTNAAVFCGQYVDGDNYWYVQKNTAAGDNKLSMVFVVGGVVKGSYVMTSAWPAVIATWYHLAFVRSGTTGYIFVDGVSQTLTETTAFGANHTGDLAAVLTIGCQNAASYFNGWLAEIRVTGRTALWTAPFAPPNYPAGGLPISSTPISVSAPVNPSTLETTYGLIRFPLVNPVILSKNEYYAVVLEYVGTNSVIINVDASTPTHAGYYIFYTSSNWRFDLTKDTVFYTHEGKTTIGVSPSYARKVFLGEDQSQIIADVYARLAGVVGNTFIARCPYDLNIKPNTKIVILDPTRLTTIVSKIKKVSYRVFLNSEYGRYGRLETFAEITLSDLDEGDLI